MDQQKTSEPIQINIDSDDPKVIWQAVLLKACQFCIEYNCKAVITEFPSVGKDGRLYLSYLIEKKTPVANH